MSVWLQALTVKLTALINFSDSRIATWSFQTALGELWTFVTQKTMLCWLFYDSGQGPVFGYSDGNVNRGVMLLITETEVSVLFKNQDYSSTRTLSHPTELAGKGWKFVGASYDRSSGEAKLWVDGNEVETKNIGADHELATQGSVIMGKSLESKITQMHVYNLSLTQEQIQIIQKRTQIPG